MIFVIYTWLEKNLSFDFDGAAQGNNHLDDA